MLNMPLPNPPQLIGFSVTDGTYLNVFLAGGFAGQIPLLAIPDTHNFMFLPEEDLMFEPQGDLFFA